MGVVLREERQLCRRRQWLSHRAPQDRANDADADLPGLRLIALHRLRAGPAATEVTAYHVLVQRQLIDRRLLHGVVALDFRIDQILQLNLPLLGQVPTYVGFRKTDLAYMRDNIATLVVKTTGDSGGYGMLMGPFATKREIEACLAKIARAPSLLTVTPLALVGE